MKKIMMFLGAISIALFMTACDDNNANDDQSAAENDNGNINDQSDADQNDNSNADNDNAVNDNNNANNEDTDANDDMQKKMDELPYAEIELEVDYGKNNEYEAEIEQDEGRPIEAEVEDEVNDVYLKGEEAFDELYPKVKALSIDKDTDKDDAIKDALETFDLDEDYEKFEIEITFNDGSELEYEDK